MRYAYEHWDICGKNPKSVMQIVTGEEPIDPESKRASMVWRYNGEKRPI